MIERSVILAVILILGAMLGAYGSRRATREPQLSTTTTGLPPGLVVFTAPFCAACTTTRVNLEHLAATVTEISVIQDPAKVREFDIRTAPTLLKIGDDGREIDRLHGAPALAELDAFIRGAES